MHLQVSDVDQKTEAKTMNSTSESSIYEYLVLQHKYLNILKSRYIYWRCNMTEDIEFILKTTTKICYWRQKNNLDSTGTYLFLFKA